MEFRFSDRIKDLNANAIREIFKLVAQPDIISFAGGLPANEGLPVAQIKEITDELLSSDKAKRILQYGATEGYAPFIESGLEYIKRAGIFGQTAENVLAISGGQQGIDLMFKAFLNKGDCVLVEEPTYLAVLHILKTYEAQPIGVKSGDDGLDLVDLEEKIIKYNPKMLYLVPTFSNPTGKTINAEKRKALAELCAKHKLVLLEDDPYCELRYDGERVPSIKSFDKEGYVLYNISFSKTVGPGLRTALIVGHKDIIRKLTLGKQATDVHTSTLSQAIVDAYLRKGYMDPNLNKVIPLYKKKKDAMLSAIEAYFPKEIKYTRPEGGLFIWVELPKYINTKELFLEAVKEKVAYVSGESFFPGGDIFNTLRLNFSNATLEQIDEGMKKLGGLLKSKIKE